MKKAVSAATTAALLASLLATAVAPSALAAITVVSAGNVPTGGTSATNVSFTFKEEANASLDNGSGSFTVTLCDSDGVAVGPPPVCTGAAGNLSFVGTPLTTGSTGSLGASASIAGNVLTVNVSASDTGNIETIFVTGLKISATSAAAIGAISATLNGGTGVAFTTNDPAGAFTGGGTARGFLATGVSIGGVDAVVNVTTTGCTFVTTGAGAGTFDFAAGVAGTTAESLDGAAGPLDAPLVGQQALTISTVGGFTSAHNAGDVVTQDTACGASPVLASPGTVVATLAYSSDGNATVFPGENNSNADDLFVVEPTAGFLAAASTFTFKILTAGVVFSTAPTVSDDDAGMVLTAPVISADRLSATVTVTTASTSDLTTITLSNILYDVASTVPAGTFISVGLTTSAAKAVLPASVTNAVVFRGIAASAPTPTVYIGENNQAAGLVTFKEAAAGFFSDGLGTATNTFEICPVGVNYRFTLAPVAMVVGGVAAGNLILRDGTSASTTNIVVGTQDTSDNFGCYFWTVWTASTTASTIVIGAAPSAATGALINVNVNQPAGPVGVDLLIGTTNFDDSLAATVVFAIAAFRNQVAVTALAQPIIAAGATNASAGDLQVAETGLGQLKDGEFICVEVLPRAQTTGTGTIQDTFLSSENTANLPVATASGSGLVISPVVLGNENNCGPAAGGSPSTFTTRFAFQVLQQTTAGDGKVVISNIHYTTTADAVNGPVLVRVSGRGLAPTVVIFQSTVSNARIGVGAKVSIGAVSALGLRPTTGYTTKSPKTQVLRKYVTWKFTGGTALAGQRVNILVAKKVNGAWGGPKYFVSRVADANGIVTFFWKSNTALAINVRVQWPGNNAYAVSTSAARGAYWK
jgi:hypothetical protein